MEAKLAAMRDGKVAVVSPEARAADEALSVALFAEWTRRRRIFRDVYDALLESCDKKPAQLKDEARATRIASHCMPRVTPKRAGASCGGADAAHRRASDWLRG